VWFLAHLTLTPLQSDEDGKREPYVVEHEFEASSWPSAWEVCMQTAAKFRARLTAHKMIEVNKGTGEITPPTHADAVACAIKDLQKVVDEAVIIPEPEPDWFKKVDVKFCIPLPWPVELSVNG
jgi:hypothetical protein